MSGDTKTEVLEGIIEKQAKIIAYMRSVVKQYVDAYEAIERKITQGSVLREEPDMDQEVFDCHNALQPVLTLWGDTKPENIDSTLAGFAAGAIHIIPTKLVN